ncbi:MAG: hypothetical protein JWQ63_1305 [Mucilaginibacter sp.]|nr:hypothetical protein [Mucilaginibacter sp.]
MQPFVKYQTVSINYISLQEQSKMTLAFAIVYLFTTFAIRKNDINIILRKKKGD